MLLIVNLGNTFYNKGYIWSGKQRNKKVNVKNTMSSQTWQLKDDIMPDSQQYSKYFFLINNLKDIVVF